MPKRKTGQRKKAEKQKERQQGIRQAFLERPLAERPCNASMVRLLRSKNKVSIRTARRNHNGSGRRPVLTDKPEITSLQQHHLKAD